jgi:hypothetical protein
VKFIRKINISELIVILFVLTYAIAIYIDIIYFMPQREGWECPYCDYGEKQDTLSKIIDGPHIH